MRWCVLAHYGAGYQGVSWRVPFIRHLREQLQWELTVDIRDGLKMTLDFYFA